MLQKKKKRSQMLPQRSLCVCASYQRQQAHHVSFHHHLSVLNIIFATSPKCKYRVSDCCFVCQERFMISFNLCSFTWFWENGVGGVTRKQTYASPRAASGPHFIFAYCLNSYRIFFFLCVIIQSSYRPWSQITPSRQLSQTHKEMTPPISTRSHSQHCT